MATTPTPQTPPELQAAVTEAVSSELMGKKWYNSKTVWTNVIAFAAIVIQMKLGFFIDPTLQTLLLAAVNAGLRKITDEPLIW